ncbi:MAG TPA: hypothetical protein VGB50_00400 [Flavobacterium sp.]|jgi:hypothetical protein
MKKFFLLFVLLSVNSFAQQVTVLGHLEDAATKEPVYAASIAVLNTAVGTVANEEGDFQLVADKNQNIAIYCLDIKK